MYVDRWIFAISAAGSLTVRIPTNSCSGPLVSPM